MKLLNTLFHAGLLKAVDAEIESRGGDSKVTLDALRAFVMAGQNYVEPLVEQPRVFQQPASTLDNYPKLKIRFSGGPPLEWTVVNSADEETEKGYRAGGWITYPIEKLAYWREQCPERLQTDWERRTGGRDAA